MKTFADNHNRVWTVAINVAAVKKCRALVGVDLYTFATDEFKSLAAFIADIVLFVDTLYILCKDEADKLGVSDEDFGRAMAGDAIQRARDAFYAELSDFFPSPAVRAGFAKVIQAMKALEEALSDRLTTLVDNVDIASLVEQSTASSGTSPESSGSTPDPSPSASST